MKRNCNFLNEASFATKCKKNKMLVLRHGYSSLMILPEKYSYNGGPSYEGYEAIIRLDNPDNIVIKSFKSKNSIPYRDGRWAIMNVDLGELEALKNFALSVSDRIKHERRR